MCLVLASRHNFMLLYSQQNMTVGQLRAETQSMEHLYHNWSK